MPAAVATKSTEVVASNISFSAEPSFTPDTVNVRPVMVCAGPLVSDVETVAALNSVAAEPFSVKPAVPLVTVNAGASLIGLTVMLSVVCTGWLPSWPPSCNCRPSA